MNDSQSQSGACKLFHSFMADGMQDLLNVDVLIGILDMFSLFLNSYLETFATVGDTRSEILEGTMSFTALYISLSF